MKRFSSLTLSESKTVPAAPEIASAFEEKKVPSPKNLSDWLKTEKPTEIGRSRT